MKKLSLSNARLLLLAVALVPGLALIACAGGEDRLVGLAAASMLALPGVWCGSKWLFQRQLKKIIEASEQFGKRDLGTRVRVASLRGMEPLTAAFNRMADAVEEREAKVRRAEEDLRRHLEKSMVLREISLAVTSTLDPHAVLKVLLEKTDLLWPGAAALVWLKNPESGAWTRTACWNLDETAWKRRGPKATPPIVKAAIESGSPVALADLAADPRTVDPEFYRRQGLVSYLGVPLVVKSRALGVLAVLTRERHDFTAEEIEFFVTLAGQAAVAIHNSQLHAESKKQALELERTNRDLKRTEAVQALLKELSQDIASQDLDSLLKKLTDKVREFLKVDIADVRVVDEDFRIMGISGIDAERMRGGSTGKRGGSRWVVENRRPLVLPDIACVKDPPIGQTARKLGIQGYVAVPLFSRRGEVVGVLRALSYRPRDFLAAEIDLLQQMSNGAAIALENARLLEQTRRQASELQQANKIKNEFLGFVSHELRTPINIIMGYAALLEGGMCGESNPEQLKVLEKITVNSQELLNMIDQLLEATKIEAGAIKADLQQVVLADFLEELRSIYSAPTQKDIELVWNFPTDLPVASTDPEKLRHILTNLLGNAVKYTDKGIVVLSARHDAEEGMVEFQIADSGIGIPAAELPHIFEMFSQVRASRPRASAGVGLGLHIVKKFTELLGGDISVASEQGAGSTFTLKIPLGNATDSGDREVPLFI